MPKTLKIGIVGCGQIVKVEQAPGLAAVPGVQITALCDPDLAKARQIKDQYAPNAVCFADYEQMLADADIDALSICTPNRLHAPMALAALENNFHVLCEKPMAGTLAEASRIISIARKYNRVLQINQSLRYTALSHTIVDLVHKGTIGDPLHIRCLRASGSTPDKNWSPGASWFVKKSEQGGLVLDIGIHMADLMTWVCGEVSQVAALVQTRTPGIDVPDHVGALFRFANGASGVLELSWALPVGGNLLEIHGTKGRIRVGFNDKGSPDKAIECVRQKGSRTVTTYPKLKQGVKSSYACFAAAVREGKPSPTPGELGRDALALCEAITRSGQQGKFVAVKTFKKT